MKQRRMGGVFPNDVDWRVRAPPENVHVIMVGRNDVFGALRLDAYSNVFVA